MTSGDNNFNNFPDNQLPLTYAIMQFIGLCRILPPTP